MIELKGTQANITLKSPTVVSGSVDLSNYYTKAETEALIPDVSGFITGSEADTKISTAVSLAEERVDFKLGSYALKTEIPDVSKFITEIPSEYITEEELNAKGYLTEHQSLEGYALKTDIPDVSGFALKSELPSIEGLATETYVNEKIAAIPEVDLTDYALKSEIPDVSGFLTEIPAEYVTESELNAKGYLTEHQSLADYSTTTEVQSMIDTAIAGITDGEAVSY